MKKIIITIVTVIVFAFTVTAQNKNSYAELDSFYVKGITVTEPNNEVSSRSLDVTPLALNLSFIPNQHSVDKTKSIGIIPVQHSMTNGALTYSVPIDVYPGSNNVQPGISLSYNSFSRDGIAGYGWNIGGLSSIYLVNHNQYFDGYTDESKMDKDGAYILDGNRLIDLKTGTGNTKNYQTEQGLIKAIAHLNGSNIKYFQISYPNGNKATFGNITNTANDLSYPITKLEDVLGNYIEYIYEKSNNIQYVIEIKYGSKKAQIGAIKFKYLNRSSMPTLYTHGSTVMHGRYLKSIETYFSTQKLKTISLTHDSSTSFLLKKIDSTNDKGESLNPLIFYYGDGNSNSTMGFTSSENNLGIFTLKPEHKIEDIPMLKANFDNDPSHTGLVLYAAPGSPYGVWNATWGQGAPKFGSTVDDAVGNGYKFMLLTDIKNATSPVTIPIGKGWLEALVADVDGDGLEEFIKINTDNNANKTSEVVTYTVYNIHSASSSEKKKFNITFNEYTTFPHYDGSSFIQNIYSSIWRQHIAGNFFGDGKNQVLSISSNKDFDNKSRQSKLNMVSFDNNTTVYSTNFDYNHQTDALFLVDYDGDGKAELGRIREGKLFIYGFKKNTSGTISMSTIISNYTLASSTLKLPNDLVIGDLNGDGKTDFLVRPINGGITWAAHYATNNSNQFIKKDMPICSHSDSFTYYLQDVNRDGIVDLIKCNSYKILSCYLGNKNGTIGTKEESILTLSEPAKFVPNNIFQNNQLYQLLGIKSKKIVHIASKQNKGIDNLLTGCINSFGVINKHSYTSLSEKNDVVYETGNSLSYPFNQMNGDIFLLQNDYTYLNNSLQSSIKYKYKRGIVDISGKGFLCYDKIDITDNIRSQTTTQTYDYNYMGALKSTDSPYNSTTYNYSKNITTSKIAKILLMSKIEKCKLKGISIATAYTYDGYNNMITQITDLGNGLKTTQTNTYSNHITDVLYKLGELTTQITKNENSSGSITSKQVLGYNTLRQVNSIKNYYKDNITSEEVFIYNTSNELSEVKNKKYSSANWVSKKYNYDNLGRRTRETDVLNNFVDFTYNAYGQLSAKKDYKLNEVKYEYDNWGNIIKTTNPDGIIATTTNSWVSSPTGAIYQVTSMATESPTSYSYYDALGRIIRSGEQRVDASRKEAYILYTDNVFNTKGQLEKTSLPFKATPSLWINYNYDSFERITSILSPSTKKESYSYSSNGNSYYTISSTSDGITQSKQYNSLGQAISVIGGGRIFYSYNADGQLSSIEVVEGLYEQGLVTSFVYDNWGRQIRINDPSSGTKQISYDNAGNINKETEANGNTVNYTYDTLDRITKKVVTTISNNEIFTTNYSYNTDGLLNSMTGANANPLTINYAYNTDFTLKSSKETVSDGKWLEKIYTYEKGKPKMIAYKSNSSNIGTETFLYSNGYLIEKLFENQSYWKLEGENIYGIPVKVSTGKITRDYEFDSYGVLKARKATVNNLTVQNLKYEFDLSNGNLLSRTDEKNNNLKESFTYDGINRLKSYNNISIKYDFKGNITEKSDVGVFFYNNASKPYAISSLKMINEVVPIRAQQITHNGLMRPSSIIENGYTAIFSYDGNGERIKMNLKKNGIEQLTRYYVGDQYEIESGLTGNKERLYLGGDAYNASSVYVKENNVWSLYHICRDYLGSITHVLDANGKLKQELSYDTWGRLRNPSTHEVYATDKEPILFLGRGYTGHEHLTWYRLINMNSRLYNPTIGRFLSPDPDLKNPDLLQNYNRYSYALNNPLKYTDPDGENPLIAFGLGFAFGYLANGYHTGDWGWNSVGSGIFVGTGISTTYAMTGGGNPWTYSGQFVANEVFSNVLGSWDVLKGNNFALSVYPYSMLTGGIANRAGNGYALGAGIAFNYDDGKTTFSLNGIGSFRNGINFEGKYSAGGGYNGYQYFLNYYSGKDAQFTGTLSVQRGKFSLRWENDVLAQSGDKYRSNATEIGWGDFIVGTNVYTTDPGGYTNDFKTWKLNGSNIFKNGRNGTYENGYQISSPFYVGHKTKYGIRRVGFNGAGIGDLVQNGFHHLKLPFIMWGIPAMSSGHFRVGNYDSPFYQSGTYTPGIMY